MRGGIIFDDEQLARLGLTVLFESQAKVVSATILRALEGLSEGDWIKLERVQFGQILERAIKVAEGIDAELHGLLKALNGLRSSGAEKRHIVVHAGWGQTADLEPTPQGYDYRRRMLLSTKDVDEALLDCADLAGMARSCAMHVARLIDEGKLVERPEGVGGAIHYNGRTIRL